MIYLIVAWRPGIKFYDGFFQVKIKVLIRSIQYIQRGFIYQSSILG